MKAKLAVFKGDRPARSSSAQIFVDKVNSFAREPITRLILYSDLVFKSDEKRTTIEIAQTGETLESIANAYYLRDYQGYQHERYAIANYLHWRGCTVYNSDTVGNEALSKLEQLVSLKIANLPVPKSAFATNPTFLKGILPYPLVAKNINASNSRLNFLVEDEEELAATIKKTGAKTLLQEYIENDGDYKVFIMYGQPVVVYKRVKSKSYHSGKIPDREVTTESDVSELAVNTAQLLGKEFCGVDVIRDKKTGKLYVLECNFNAGMQIMGLGDELLIKGAAALVSKNNPPQDP